MAHNSGFDHAELKKRAQHRVHISTNPKTGVANSRLIVQVRTAHRLNSLRIHTHEKKLEAFHSKTGSCIENLFTEQTMSIGYDDGKKFRTTYYN